MERAALAAHEGRSYAVIEDRKLYDMRPRPFYILPRIYRGALGWWYVRWGRKLWMI
jgi:hypothetical protein